MTNTGTRQKKCILMSWETKKNQIYWPKGLRGCQSIQSKEGRCFTPSLSHEVISGLILVPVKVCRLDPQVIWYWFHIWHAGHKTQGAYYLSFALGSSAPNSLLGVRQIDNISGTACNLEPHLVGESSIEYCTAWRTWTTCDFWPAPPPPCWENPPGRTVGGGGILPDTHGRTGIQFSPAPPQDNRVKWPSDPNESVCQTWVSWEIPASCVAKVNKTLAKTISSNNYCDHIGRQPCDLNKNASM